MNIKISSSGSLEISLVCIQLFLRQDTYPGKKDPFPR